MHVILEPMSTLATAHGLEVLFTREQIQARVAEMGAQIARDYAGESIILIGVLKGAAIFLSDLARAVPADCTFDFVAVSSYGTGSTTSGAARLIKDLDLPIEGKHVIVVEDILDTGVTLGYLTRMFERHHPRSLKIAAFLDKPARRIHPIQADYVGFTIPNHFVVGYGLDYAERFRNLPEICVLPTDQIG
jgi:hypoxanthine phosphoribosyltransferase